MFFSSVHRLASFASLIGAISRRRQPIPGRQRDKHRGDIKGGRDGKGREEGQEEERLMLDKKEQESKGFMRASEGLQRVRGPGLESRG
jgi:hypothetical protein